MRKTVILPQSTGSLRLRELWQHRELLYIFCWRELKVRYKQTAIGVAWAVLRPLATMAIMTFIFHRVAGLNAGTTSYPVFVMTGMLAWQFFSVGFAQAAQSLVADRAVISKVYFPRIILPISSILTAAVDFLIVFLLLLGLMALTDTPLSWRLIGLPFFFGWLCVLTIGLSLWFAALNVRYRDFRYIIPILLQLGFYASPVGFGTENVPDRYLTLFSLNPLVGLIDGFRWAILGVAFPSTYSLVLGGVITVVVLIFGWRTFLRTEDYITDII